MRPWKPLSVPIRLRAGTIQSPQFRVGFSAKYRILVSAERRIEFKRLNCMLGMEVCDEVPDVIDISWLVLHNGAVAESGSSLAFRGGYYSDNVAREIGEFSAHKGQSYSIVLTIGREGSALDATAPRLLVETQPWEWKDAVVGSIIATYVAELLVVVAVLIIGLPPVFSFLYRRFVSLKGIAGT